ncbi:MAG: zinc-dependent metalloprotease [Saprospiraceae bacterium]|nr:zinc-dependent metalloprotease [Saprospiraceae bacterium]
MKKIFILFSFQLIFACMSTLLFAQAKAAPLPDPTKMTAFQGYQNFYFDETGGKIWLKIDHLDEEFLLVNGLPAGLGSNDIGLDRGQIGESKVVSFKRSGSKVLLIQSNYQYRAVSQNPSERKAVEEAFAQSAIWGFELKTLEDGTQLIDLTPFLLSDQHGVANSLKRTKQGNYAVDDSRSAIFPDRVKAFPENIEFEATITFKGTPEGSDVRTVSPNAEYITLRQHLSFIKLPDNKYKPRIHDPQSGFIYVDFYDYAQPIERPINQRYIVRHRLEKANPGAKKSKAVEPIIYYLDPGTPEPVRSALLEGASWWNEAFEAAGFIDAFQVKMLPEDADPMDVRYNVIQWVHRSTRGWSYGASIVDPRTGEIIKGHVSLGSLRVRQDFLIAQGLVPIYENGQNPDPVALEMALARLRQLAAHEVGHTIGLTHNFAASINDRASVMDYPHPLILSKVTGLDFSNAYDTGIGNWDKQAILYGYQQFAPSENEQEKLNRIIEATDALGLLFISDEDSRPYGGASPDGHLWDNGINPVAEMQRLLDLRTNRLQALGQNNIAPGSPNFELERVLTPLYLAHRYQVEACAKLIGGVSYSYANDSRAIPVSEAIQDQALDAILTCLRPEHLAIPKELLELLPPPPPGYRRDREFFPSYTDPVFDPVAASEAIGTHAFQLLLHPDRLARITRQYALGYREKSLPEYLEKITIALFTVPKENPYVEELCFSLEVLFVEDLFRLALNPKIDSEVIAAAYWQISRIQLQLQKENNTVPKVHDSYLLARINQFMQGQESFEPLPEPKIPPGSPIGCGENAEF